MLQEREGSIPQRFDTKQGAARSSCFQHRDMEAVCSRWSQLSNGKVLTTVSGIMSSYRLGYDGFSSYVSLTMPVKQTNNYKTYGLFFLSPLSVSRQQDPSGLTAASRNCIASWQAGSSACPLEAPKDSCSSAATVRDNLWTGRLKLWLTTTVVIAMKLKNWSSQCPSLYPSYGILHRSRTRHALPLWWPEQLVFPCFLGRSKLHCINSVTFRLLNSLWTYIKKLSPEQPSFAVLQLRLSSYLKPRMF